MNRKLFLQPNLRNQNKYDTKTLEKNFDDKDVFFDTETNLLNVNGYTIDETDSLFQRKLSLYLPGNNEMLIWNSLYNDVEFVDQASFDVENYFKGLFNFGNNLIFTYDQINDTFVWKEIEIWLTAYSTTAETNAMINSSINVYDINIETQLSQQFYNEIEIDNFLSTINLNIEDNTNDITDLQTLVEIEETEIDGKEDDLLENPHTDEEMLIWDAIQGIKWIDEVDLSPYATINYVDTNFQTKLQFFNDEDIAIWDGVNEIIDYVPLNEYEEFLNYYKILEVDELLNEKQNKLSSYADFYANAIAIPNGTLDDVEFVNIYTQYLNNYVEVTTLNYLLSLYLLKSEFNAEIANYYTILQTDGLLSGKENNLLNIAHAANQVLTINSTNDGIEWKNPGSTNIEAYFSSLTSFGTYLIYSYNGTIFDFFTPAQMSIATTTELDTKCDKGVSVNNFENFQILNNSSSTYHFKVSTVTNEYLNIYYNNTICRNANYSFKNLDGTNTYMSLSEVEMQSMANTIEFYSSELESLYCRFSLTSFLFARDQQNFYNTARNATYLSLGTSSNIYRNASHYFENAFGTNELEITTTQLISSKMYNLFGNVSGTYIEFDNHFSNEASMFFNTAATLRYHIYLYESSPAWYMNFRNTRTDGGTYNCVWRDENGNILSYISENTGAYTTVSDENRKENIKKCSCELKYFDDFSKLFCGFNYKGKKDNGRSFGVIAQELLKIIEDNNIDVLSNCILKQEIEENNKNEYLTVDHQQLYGYMINMLFEKTVQQQNEIEELKQQNKNMQNEIDEIMQLLEKND